MKKPLFLLAMLSLVTWPAAAQDAIVAWQERDEDLVRLSGVLGGMHHLHRMCNPYEYDATYRDHMKDLVILEEPRQSTKDRMIAAFNDGFQSATGAYRGCSFEAREEMRRLADRGDVITNRLATPFRDLEQATTVDSLELDTGRTVNGVTIYEGRQD